MTRAGLKTTVLRLAQVDLAKIGAGADDDALDMAIVRYNQDAPKVVTAILGLSDGGAVLPDGFVWDFSTVRQAEYPLSQRPPLYLRTEDFYTYNDGTVARIELVAGSNEEMRIWYTVRHIASATEYTLPEQHTEAVASWAAAVLCEMEASRLSSKNAPTISADSANQQDPARAFAARAKTLRQRYLDELGVDTKRNVPASADVSFTQRDSKGRTRLTHPLPVQTWN
ncbi:MAG: hypothetical protein PHR16_11775 [Methylovulum sp.]|nr:hypothetical protein [Methylovulum sp.]